MVNRYTSLFLSILKVIILIPPIFPFLLLLTAKRILNVSLPNGVPVAGVCDNVILRSDNSFLRDGNFFINLLAWVLKIGVGITL